MTAFPRLLLGAALLFWGATTGRWVPSLAAALLVEGANWSRIRWDFGEKAGLVAWRLTVLFLTIAMVLVVLQGGPRLTTMPRVFTWLPVVLLPLQFVQSYGISPTLTLGTFSMMVRRRRLHAEKYGLPFREVRFGFGYVFFCATLLSASLGEKADSAWFFPLLLVLVAWAIVARSGKGWRGLSAATALALILSAFGGLGGQKGLTALYMFSMGSSSSNSRSLDRAREKSTEIGTLGEIKQSTEIYWRMIPEKGLMPKLLRVASYNTYGSYTHTGWATLLPKDVGNETADFKSPTEVSNPANPEDPEDIFRICPADVIDNNSAIDPQLARFRLRGSIATSGRFGLLPLPANAASLHEFVADNIERNSFGTFRVEISQPVNDAVVLWDDRFATDQPPWESVIRGGGQTVRPDLMVHDREIETIRQTVDEIGMREGSVEDKIQKLREHFTRHFRYTKYNRVPRDLDEWEKRDKKVGNYPTTGKRTLLGAFLQYSHAGHCEYFATATALLLREAGVPTRYASGFAVIERDSKSGEALLRGTHAHAWCRAWDEENKRWLDVDLTPSSWIGMEVPPRPERFQALRDKFQMLREDLLVWRDKPGHMAIITASLLTPVLIGLAFVGRNLWRSRRRLEKTKRERRGAAAMYQTPLSTLEKRARRILGERPEGMPLGRWLMPLAEWLESPGLLAEALAIHQQLRFDPGAGDPGLLPRLQRLVTEISRQIGSKRI